MALPQRLHMYQAKGMTQEEAARRYELEESAQGTDLYRAPGEDLQEEEARDQAEASGWIPESEPVSVSGPVTRVAAHHHSMRESMSELEFVASRPAGTSGWHGVVDNALQDLGESLQEHIDDVEGPTGLLADIMDEAPRLTTEIDLVRKEHAALLKAWSQARLTVRGSEAIEKADVDAVRRRVMTLLGRLVLHRHRAADLVYEAYNVDISAAD